jgi:hypothetical protein
MGRDRGQAHDGQDGKDGFTHDKFTRVRQIKRGSLVNGSRLRWIARDSVMRCGRNHTFR